MKTFMAFGLAASLANLTLASLTHPNTQSVLKPKRALLTCLETYGGGSITCGDADSQFCYDPSLGETCCAMDNGYCKAGDFCAPVAGYCCTIGEDPETCAVRLDFTLPPTYSIAIPTEFPTEPSPKPDVTASPTEAAALTTTSTVQIILASILPDEVTILAAAPTLDTDGMTPQFTAPVGNKMVPDDTAPVNATNPAAATKTAAGNVVEFTGAAVANRVSEMGSALGFVFVFAGLVL